MMLIRSLGGCTVVVLFLAFSLASADDIDLDRDSINNEANDDSMLARRGLQMKRGFGSASGRNPFTSVQNGDFVNWRDIFSPSSKRSMVGRPTSAFSEQSAFDRGQLQNWIDYFTRATRAFGPNTRQRSRALHGSYGGFGVDGLQNWRAFFDDQNQRGYGQGFGR